jgi:hypothetical protein
MKGPETQREIPVLRIARGLCEQRERRSASDPQIERVGLRLARRFRERNLRDLVPKRSADEPSERSPVGQPRDEHGQARIHRF